jgi:hypothetical protein
LDGRNEIFLLGDRDYAVTAHDGADAGQVGMTAVAIEGGDFEVILGTHYAGGLEAEDAGRGVHVVGVGVGCAAGDEKGDAAADFAGFVVEGPGHGAIDAEDSFVVFAMEVRKRDASEGSSKRSKAQPVSWRVLRKVTLISPTRIVSCIRTSG